MGIIISLQSRRRHVHKAEIEREGESECELGLEPHPQRDRVCISQSESVELKEIAKCTEEYSVRGHKSGANVLVEHQSVAEHGDHEDGQQHKERSDKEFESFIVFHINRLKALHHRRRQKRDSDTNVNIKHIGSQRVAHRHFAFSLFRRQH